MINAAYEYINAELNKDQRGKLTPSEFNIVARAAQSNVTDNLLSDFRQVAYRESRGAHGANLGSQTEYSEQIVEFYLNTWRPVRPREIDAPITGTYKLPRDLRSISVVAMANGDEVEKVTKPEFHRMINTKSGKPNSCYPVYYRHHDSITIFPKAYRFFVTYIRIPKTPKWTYREIQGVPIFDNSQPDFQDLDIPYDLFSEFIREALRLSGISLRELDVAQIIQNDKQIDTQNENT